MPPVECIRIFDLRSLYATHCKLSPYWGDHKMERKLKPYLQACLIFIIIPIRSSIAQVSLIEDYFDLMRISGTDSVVVSSPSGSREARLDYHSGILDRITYYDTISGTPNVMSVFEYHPEKRERIKEVREIGSMPVQGSAYSVWQRTITSVDDAGNPSHEWISGPGVSLIEATYKQSKDSLIIEFAYKDHQVFRHIVYDHEGRRIAVTDQTNDHKLIRSEYYDYQPKAWVVIRKELILEYYSGAKLPNRYAWLLRYSPDQGHPKKFFDGRSMHIFTYY